MEQMTGDQAIKILDTLMLAGKVPADLVEKILRNTVSEEVEKAVDLLHLLFCTGRHNSVKSETPEFCNFEQEESKALGWEKPAHKKWIDYTNKVANDLEITVDELHDILVSLRGTMKEIEANMDANADAVSLLKLFINTREGLQDLVPTFKAIIKGERGMADDAKEESNL